MSKCRCLHFEADLDAQPDGWLCHCGHDAQDHRPTKEYPGDRSCKANEDPDE